MRSYEITGALLVLVLVPTEAGLVPGDLVRCNDPRLARLPKIVWTVHSVLDNNMLEISFKSSSHKPLRVHLNDITPVGAVQKYLQSSILTREDRAGSRHKVAVNADQSLSKPRTKPAPLLRRKTN